MIYLILTLILMILIQSFFNMIVWSNRRKITKKKFIIAVNKTILQFCFGVCLAKSPFTIIT